MTLIYALGLIVIGGVLFLLASLIFGRGEDLPALPAGGTPTELPDDRPLTAADAREVRLPVTVRGYRMTDADWVIERMADALDDRDVEIASLRRQLAAGATGPPRTGPIEPGRADPPRTEDTGTATAFRWHSPPTGTIEEPDDRDETDDAPHDAPPDRDQP